MTVFNIGEIHSSTPHLFADLAELLLLLGLNGKEKLHKNDLMAIREHSALSVDEADEDARQTTLEHSASTIDRHEKQLEDVWTQLNYREGAFAQYYPFLVARDELCLQAQTLEHRIYRLLLCCSRLRSFGLGGLPQRWARAFTHLSKAAMQGLLPPQSTAKIFDANSDDRRTYYGTNLRQALQVLGKDLGILQINEAECNNASSSGDAGLDLIAVLTQDDGAAVNFSILGQCGAQEKEWPSKTLEAHSISIRNYFQIQFDYPSVMFTPVCFRNSDGSWVNNRFTNGIYLADRLRITNLIDCQNIIPDLVSQNWFNDFEREYSQVKLPDT